MSAQTYIQLYLNISYENVDVVALYREGDNLNRIAEYLPEERSALEAILIREAWRFSEKKDT